MNKALIFFIFFMLTVNCFSKSDSLTVKYDKSSIVQKKFNKENLDLYKSDKKFNYTEEIEEKSPTLINRFFNWLGRQFLKFLEWLFGVNYAKGIFAKILMALPYIIAALVLFLIIKFFLKVNSNLVISTAKNKSTVTITVEEELIKNKDLAKLIQQAIQQKKYRLAVRYYYLNCIKQLEESELISWEQQKTNEDYIKEISEKNIKKTFKELTRLYDFVWYGNFEINEIEFFKVQSNFEKANNLIYKK